MKYEKTEKYDIDLIKKKIMGPNPLKLEEELMKENKIKGFVLFIIPLMIGFIDIKILESLICGVATFSAIQEGYYIKIGKI